MRAPCVRCLSNFNPRYFTYLPKFIVKRDRWEVVLMQWESSWVDLFIFFTDLSISVSYLGDFGLQFVWESWREADIYGFLTFYNFLISNLSRDCVKFSSFLIKSKHFNQHLKKVHKFQITITYSYSSNVLKIVLNM